MVFNTPVVAGRRASEGVRSLLYPYPYPCPYRVLVLVPVQPGGLYRQGFQI